MKKNMRKRLGALFMAFIMVLSMVAVPSVKTEAAAKKYVKSLKLSKASVSVEAGKKVTVNATVAVKGSAKKNVTVKSDNTKVAKVKVGKPSKKGASVVTITGVKKGTATVTVKTKDKNTKKKVISKKIKVTVNSKSSDEDTSDKDSSDKNTADDNKNNDTNNNTNNNTNNDTNNNTNNNTNNQTNNADNNNNNNNSTDGGGSSDSGSGGDTSVGSSEDSGNETGNDDPETPEPEIKTFTRNDYTVSYSTVEKVVDFKINKSIISAEELEKMGYTISEDKTSASKTNTLAKATYTFTKLPSTLDELKNFSIDSDVQTVNGVELDFGMCAPLAATVLAFHSYEPTSRTDYNNPLAQMCEYLNGYCDLANVNKGSILGQLIDHPNIKNCYFGGASPYNGYRPDEPFTITVEEGPYYIPERTSSTGDKQPERRMVFIYFDGADSERYIDVYKDDNKWYVWDDQAKHLTASIKDIVTIPEPGDEGDITPFSYDVEKSTVEKEVRFKINKAVISAEELRDMGYTISEDGNEASKMNTLAKATYTFTSLPTTIDEIKGISMQNDIVKVGEKDGKDIELDYGMFGPLVASILAFHTFTPSEIPLDTSNPVIAMMDYINGGYNIANYEKQNIVEKLTYNPAVKNCYFDGATPANNYTPNTPFKITVEEGPYYIPERNSINGYEPERHMVFVAFEGADDSRYIDVYKASKNNKWYCYTDSFKHLYASVKDTLSLKEPDGSSDTEFKDYSVKYDTVEKEVKFKIAEDRISAEELREMGYTISEDGKEASKMNTLATATFTFTKLPATLDDIKGFSLKKDVRTVNGVKLDYGMLRPMVASILAYHTFDSLDGNYTENPIVDMLDYINGGYDIANVNKQNLITQLKSNPNIKNCYFGGATPGNGYEPTEPFTITVTEGPYYIPEKETITGFKPERHMVFVSFEGADDDRYIDVYYDSRTNSWYSFEDSFKHLYASVKPAGE